MNLPFSSTQGWIPLAAPLSRTLPGLRRASWDGAAWLIALAALVVVLASFGDFGLTHDEEVQAIYGEKLLSWYRSGFTDHSAFEYLDLYWYGGLFDLVAALLNKISPFGYYQTRHLLGGLVGVAGILGAWRLGRMAGGPRAGLIALVLLTLTPSFIGHSFNNPKDAPFAVAMVWGLVALADLVAGLPRPGWRPVLWFAAAFGVALGARVGAYLLVGYFGLAAIGVYGRRLHVAGTGRDFAILIGRCLAGLVLSWILVALFWPWAAQSPLNPFLAMSHFSRYDIDIDSLFNGRLVPATDLPAMYLPGYLTVTLPEATLIGLLAAVPGLLSRRFSGDRRVVALTGLAAFFPIAFFILFRPTAYDGMRHFLFVVPPLSVLAAVGLDRIWGWAEARSARLGRGVACALLVAAVIQTVIIARLHPDEYIYYNALVGGVRGADGKWEMDYWSNSMHEAVDRLSDAVLLENGGQAPSTPVKVRICGNGLSATAFFPPYLKEAESLEEADYMLAFTQVDCWKTWRGRPVAEIERFGAVLSVVKDRRGLSDPGEE